jgi:hypothetical protein
MHQVRIKVVTQKTALRRTSAGFFYNFPNHMKILLGDFNAKVGRENIFKPIIGNESLHRTIMIMGLE